MDYAYISFVNLAVGGKDGKKCYFTVREISVAKALGLREKSRYLPCLEGDVPITVYDMDSGNVVKEAQMHTLNPGSYYTAVLQKNPRLERVDSQSEVEENTAENAEGVEGEEEFVDRDPKQAGAKEEEGDEEENVLVVYLDEHVQPIKDDTMSRFRVIHCAPELDTVSCYIDERPISDYLEPGMLSASQDIEVVRNGRDMQIYFGIVQTEKLLQAYEDEKQEEEREKEEKKQAMQHAKEEERMMVVSSGEPAMMSGGQAPMDMVKKRSRWDLPMHSDSHYRPRAKKHAVRPAATVELDSLNQLSLNRQSSNTIFITVEGDQIALVVTQDLPLHSKSVIPDQTDPSSRYWHKDLKNVRGKQLIQWKQNKKEFKPIRPGHTHIQPPSS